MVLQPTDADISRSIKFKWGGISREKTPKGAVAIPRHWVSIGVHCWCCKEQQGESVVVCEEGIVEWQE
jgi:hypothetical protein